MIFPTLPLKTQFGLFTDVCELRGVGSAILSGGRSGSGAGQNKSDCWG